MNFYTMRHGEILYVQLNNATFICFKMCSICKDVASDVGVNFKNVGVLSIESSLFHLFHYTFLQIKHQRKGYYLYFTLMKNERQIKIQRKSYR